MGANFGFIKMKELGDCGFSKLDQTFKEMQKEATYLHEHEYSGDWNMCSGLHWTSYPDTIKTESELEDWAMDNCEKWDNAIAMFFQGSWYIAGWRAE